VDATTEVEEEIELAVCRIRRCGCGKEMEAGLVEGGQNLNFEQICLLITRRHQSR
jgi:hypothetical protein